MLKLSSSFDSVLIYIAENMTEWVINCYILCHFKFLTMIYTVVSAGAGSGSATLVFTINRDSGLRPSTVGFSS
jgi:hypothetical protein